MSNVSSHVAATKGEDFARQFTLEEVAILKKKTIRENIGLGKNGVSGCQRQRSRRKSSPFIYLYSTGLRTTGTTSLSLQARARFGLGNLSLPPVFPAK